MHTLYDITHRNVVKRRYAFLYWNTNVDINFSEQDVFLE